MLGNSLSLILGARDYLSMLGAKEEDFHERWSTSDGSPFGDTLEIPRSY